jgi:protein-disulfide isomerase
MENKKTIIFGLMAIIVLAGVVWYVSQHKQPAADQAASLLGDSQTGEQSQPVLTEEFVLGNPEAPVTIIEYASHLCGHCANFHLQTLPLIMDKYIKTGKVKLILRLLSPMELSQAVICAQEQGAFWEFNEYLFEHVRELKSKEDLKAIATTLGLNQENFNQCLNTGKYKDKAMEWFNQAKEAGIKGTPTFFINGQEIVGNQPYNIFEETIEQALTQ